MNEAYELPTPFARSVAGGQEVKRCQRPMHSPIRTKYCLLYPIIMTIIITIPATTTSSVNESNKTNARANCIHHHHSINCIEYIHYANDAFTCVCCVKWKNVRILRPRYFEVIEQSIQMLHHDCQWGVEGRRETRCEFKMTIISITHTQADNGPFFRLRSLTSLTIMSSLVIFVHLLWVKVNLMVSFFFWNTF